MATSDKHSWIESSDVVSLFPTLVWKIQLRDEMHEPIDASALGWSCSTLRLRQPGGRERAAIPEDRRTRDRNHRLLDEPVCAGRRAPRAQPPQQLPERGVLRVHPPG